MEPNNRFDIVRINQRNVDVLDVVADDVFDDEINDELLQAVLDNGQLLFAAIFDGAVVGQLQAMIQHHLDGPPQLYIDNPQLVLHRCVRFPPALGGLMGLT